MISMAALLFLVYNLSRWQKDTEFKEKGTEFLQSNNLLVMSAEPSKDVETGAQSRIEYGIKHVVSCFLVF